MVKDRLDEFLERRSFKDEYKFVQEHEFLTLYTQEQVLEDLDRFSEIANWIRELQRNILDIEVNIFAEGFTKAAKKLKENAGLCYKIYTAVKRMQTEFDEQEVREQDDLVSRVRSAQFESMKTAYIKAYWKYNGVISRYEDKIRRTSLVLASSMEELDPGPSDSLLLHTENRRLSLGHPSCSDSVAQSQNTLNALNHRHQELLALERSLVEMRDLFVLFSTLVMEHGSILNLVEGNIQLASGHVKNAVQELETAREYQWQATKRKCLCFNQMGIMIVMLALLVAIAIIMMIKRFLL